MYLATLLLFFFVLCLIGCSQGLTFIKEEEANAALQVKCEGGIVQGQMKSTSRKQLPYRSFKGIPFAKPPVGDLRFKDPLPAKSWSQFGILNGIRENKGCPSSPLLQRSVEHRASKNASEDCLYLNVYIPKTNSNGNSLLPVVVWLFGGGFVLGASRFATYGPDYFLERGVIMVTLNYRTGIFGFLSTGDLECPGNMGLKDQNLAIQWVKNNIQQFGGDPEQITLQGQSAGAASVHYHILSPKSKGLFQRAITESGNALTQWSLQRYGREIAYKTALDLGITSRNTSHLLEQMRKLDTETLRKAEDFSLILMMFLGSGADIAFAPVIEPDHDGAFISRPSFDVYESGDFSRVPILMGITSQEAGFFNELLASFRPVSFLQDAFSDVTLMRNFNFRSTREKKEAVRLSKEKYLRKGFFENSPDEEIINLYSDENFVRPSIKVAQLISNFVPVYFYYMAYESEIGLQYILHKGRTVSGAFHGEELGFLFSRSDIKFSNKRDRLQRERINTLWTNFIKYGTPTPSKDPLLDNVIWEPVNSTKVRHIVIDKSLTILEDFTLINMTFWDSLIQNYCTKPYLTY